MSIQPMLTRLDQKKKMLDESRPLPPASVKSLIDDFRLRFTHETTALEGNTLTLRETQAVLEEGITVHGKSLREHLEIIMKFHEILMKHGIHQHYLGRKLVMHI